MALKKQITGDKGIIINYIRIADIQQNFINAEPILEVYLYGYASSDFRDTEKEELPEDIDVQMAIWFERFRLPMDDEKGYSRAEVYERLKNEVELFKGAEDC